MKYMILTFGSQDDYDGMAGKGSAKAAWSGEDWAALGAFMQAFNRSSSSRASWSRPGG